MNTERLHAIARAVKRETVDASLAPQVTELAQSLRQAADEPKDPAHQQRVSTLRTELGEALANAPSNGFSPAWLDALQELGIDDLLGEALRARIEQIFEQNEITASVAAVEMAPLAERVQQLQDALEQVEASFTFFEIDAEELAPGEFEIGFLIPRERMHDGLEELGKEFIKLTLILAPFQEISPGPRDELKVRSISSSAFGAFLMASPGLALLLAKTLESLINSYEKVKGMREGHAKLKESGAQDKLLKEAAKEVSDIITREIKALTKTLLAEATKEKRIDKDRANELRKYLEVSLNSLANRIDQGYTIGVRPGELPPPQEDDEAAKETAEQKKTRAIVEQVLEAQEKLNFKNDTGESILQLPEPKDPPPETGAPKAGPSPAASGRRRSAPGNTPKPQK